MMRLFTLTLFCTVWIALTANALGDPATPTPMPASSIEAPPRITIKDGAFVTPDGAPFHPHGFHYTNLSEHSSEQILSPGQYDPQAAESMLADLEQNGFNTVYITIVFSDIYKADGTSTDYLANLTHFLESAAKHHVYVLLSFNGEPYCNRYFKYLHENKPQPTATPSTPPETVLVTPELGPNARRYMSPTFIKAKIQVISDFIQLIKNTNPALLAVILAYSLDDDSHFYNAEPPFSITKGAWTAPSGKTYDLADPEALQRLADDAARDWANTYVDAIHTIDPGALITTGLTTYQFAGRTGPEQIRDDSIPQGFFPLRPTALAESKLSFLDIHLMLMDPAALESDLDSIEFAQLQRLCKSTGKPLLAGELRAYTFIFPSLAETTTQTPALAALLEQRGFAGFLYRPYQNGKQQSLYEAKAGQGEIFSALAGLIKPPAQ